MSDTPADHLDTRRRVVYDSLLWHAETCDRVANLGPAELAQVLRDLADYFDPTSRFTIIRRSGHPARPQKPKRPRPRQGTRGKVLPLSPPATPPATPTAPGTP